MKMNHTRNISAAEYPNPQRRGINPIIGTNFLMIKYKNKPTKKGILANIKCTMCSKSNTRGENPCFCFLTLR